MTDVLTQSAAEPPWLALARRELGVGEGEGPADNARVLAYYRDAGHPEIAHDSVAWCAAFACAMLERSGIASPRSLLARDFLRWGEPLAVPRPGCIVVLWRGSPDSSQGHVGFYAGTMGDHIVLIGGNQGDQVSTAAFPAPQVLGFRWPHARTPEIANPAPAEPTPIFDRALAHVLVQEGGWTDDPYDPGGPTNKGITLAEFARWEHAELSASTLGDLRARLRAIDPATVRRIYLANYWLPACCPDLPAPIAFLHFDCSVNQGVSRATRFLQTALEVEADGEIGPLTLTAAARAGPATVIDAYCELRAAHYRSFPHFWRFGRGWINRVNATRRAALALADSTLPSPAPTPRKETAPMPTNPQSPATPEPKWWGRSMTIWGVVVTTLSAVVPIAARACGIDLPAQLVQDLGTQITVVLQAIGGLAGIVITIAGRVRATQPLNISLAPPPSPPPFGPRDWRRSE